MKRNLYFKKGNSVLWHPQTPYGAARILDSKRTRLSWVSHLTPLNVPVYEQDVFFTGKKVSDKASWYYGNIGKRRYVRHEMISFAHQCEYRLEELK